ncbi:helix-hairpin-helix domain-containing protein [Paenibacillus marchantiae]|uniref:helix-hairpin-helix domain-containing protein n=1 Tax=Paenibacillus marchantiae TaxID=3026433 RepID=UPI00237AD2FD|nr:helix-hairpin-helix domain-containing protein [Paenibacillus marchantiae]WDQ32177.1 helix-hairpin-helix domain-containing protein [Paenibacillus marchantiae]
MLEQTLEALATEIEEYDLIQSIPGIGPKIAATTLSKIGEVALVACANMLVHWLSAILKS